MPPSESKPAAVKAPDGGSSPSEAAGLRALFDALRLNPEQGTVRVRDQPVVLIRPEVIVNIQKQLEQTIGGSAKGIMYLAGERSASDSTNLLLALFEESGGPLTLGRLRRLLEATALTGWGKMDVVAFDSERGRIVFRVMNSPLATAYGPSKKPVCHLISGSAAGLARTLLQRDVLCEESACRAQGREHCEFELRPMPTS